MQIVSSPFQQWAAEQGYDLTPAKPPDEHRIYHALRTQDVYAAWRGGAAYIVRMLTESMLNTEALREKLFEFAGPS
jgi:hypothetical protein